MFSGLMCDTTEVSHDELKFKEFKSNILSSFTHPRVFLNLYDQKRRYFEECFRCFCPHDENQLSSSIHCIIWTTEIEVSLTYRFETTLLKLFEVIGEYLKENVT